MSEKQEVDFTGDEYWGKGGNYVVDPATGKRRPASPVEAGPTAEAAPAQVAPAAEIENNADPAKNLKEKRRA